MAIPMKEDQPRERLIQIEANEVGIVIREGGKVDVHMTLGKVVEKAQLLGLAIAWSAESEEWKTSMMKRARERLLEIMAEVEAEKMTQADS